MDLEQATGGHRFEWESRERCDRGHRGSGSLGREHPARLFHLCIGAAHEFLLHLQQRRYLFTFSYTAHLSSLTSDFQRWQARSTRVLSRISPWWSTSPSTSEPRVRRTILTKTGAVSVPSSLDSSGLSVTSHCSLSTRTVLLSRLNTTWSGASASILSSYALWD